MFCHKKLNKVPFPSWCQIKCVNPDILCNISLLFQLKPQRCPQRHNFLEETIKNSCHTSLTRCNIVGFGCEIKILDPLWSSDFQCRSIWKISGSILVGAKLFLWVCRFLVLTNKLMHITCIYKTTVFMVTKYNFICLS